jgi:DMSO/TMAO reductase YedYZ molybdopterin-dependent catalytic subunit
MKIRSLGLATGALVGGLATAPLLGLMYLANELVGLPFAPYDLFDWATRVLPGWLITFGIDMMIDTLLLFGISVADTAKTAEKVIAVLQFFVIGVAMGALFFALMRQRGARPDRQSGMVLGAILGLPMTTISIAIGGSENAAIFSVIWLMALFLAWGETLRKGYNRLNIGEPVTAPAEGQATGVDSIGRRQFLIRLGGATATITVASTVLGGLLAAAARRELEEELAESVAHQARADARAPFPNSSDPLMPAPGTRPEYTPLKDHYKVFIRVEPTTIDGATWSLPIMGAVENPMTLTIDDIRNNYESRDQYVTLSCISGRVGTDLISTTQWTGVSVQDILADVKPNENAGYLHITSGDGFYETVDLDLIASDERIMLAYDWDGHPIPLDHGFPLRIWLPDRFGMKQPKWITGIEVIEEYKRGYWVDRGWDEVARVQATSVIDTVAADAVYQRDGQTLVPVGGIAFAGARGISRVEVRVDEGPWQEAVLRTPLSETTWVIWRYDWPFQDGRHDFEVRCAELDGTPQIEEERGNRPSGARGIHRKRANL